MQRRWTARRRLATAVACIALAGALAAARALAGPLVADANTDRSAYAPGAGLTLWVDLVNGTGATFDGQVEVAISHLGVPVATLAAQPVTALAAGAAATKSWSWTTPALDFQGYLVVVTVRGANGTVADSSSCAIDVSSDWTRFPRYGYVAWYDTDPATSWHVMWLLKNYHLNAVQFYDWQWKHHWPYNGGASWPDIANRTNQRATVNDLLSAAHAYGMLAFNYNLYGGAWDGYGEDGSGADGGMAIYDGAHHPLSVGLPAGWGTSRLWEMNNRDPRWLSYIFGREADVFANFAFDGWHVDCLGQHDAWDWGGNHFSLDDYNAAFVNAAKSALGKRMLINTVDAVGETQVASGANVDALYSELWDGNAHYADFLARSEAARTLGGKAPIFAAYLNRDLASGSFDEASVRLADAAIFACGADHLELGDGDKMLHVEYFPNDRSVVMSTSLQSALHAYYDFLVGYENLLRDGTSPASMTASIDGVSTSTDASAGTVWVLPRQNAANRVVHLVNLLGNTSTLWRDAAGTYPEPPLQANLAVKLYLAGPVGRCTLRWASPDRASCAAAALDYVRGSDAGGTFIRFVVPELRYWDVIWLESCPGTEDVGAIAPAVAPLALSAPWPNPAGGAIRCDLRLGSGATVRAEIFDLAGQRVRTLLAGAWLPAGTHALAWDQRDDRGAAVAPGVYELRVGTGGHVAAARITVLR